ncbi:hypothetical protein ABZW96_33100 [Nocardia sp. NPDC004168]|uniref:hypothetical protein n=1 Tax=Nocardia sp. NPDC004168 TaxID=3154452 RepID=UPI0033A4BB0F
MEERIAGVLAVLERLDRTAPVVVVDEIGRRVEDLKHEVRTSIADDQQRRRTLLSQISKASEFVAAARERGERALDIAVATLQRELHDAEHPRITSPQKRRRPQPGTQR